MSRRAQLALLNALSLSRFGLAVLFVLVNGATARIALIVVAAASDALDGWVARRSNLATRWGALIDPIADRTFVLTALTTYLVEGSLTATQYYLLLIRDLATAVGFVVARAVPSLRAVPLQARPLGKAVTALQLAVLLAVPLSPGVAAPLVFVVGALSVAAIADYSVALWRAREAR